MALILPNTTSRRNESWKLSDKQGKKTARKLKDMLAKDAKHVL